MSKEWRPNWIDEIDKQEVAKEGSMGLSGAGFNAEQNENRQADNRGVPAVAYKEIKVGTGNAAFRVDSQGLYLGSEQFLTAPFRVTMAGALTATSVTITGVVTTFAQASIPTSLAAGDLWFDTDDNNKLYRAAIAGADEIAAGEWVAVNDPTATTLLGGSVSYSVVAGGMFSFGDGSDGDVTITGVDATLSADKYYNNLTVEAGRILYTGGYRIFVKGTLTANGTIQRNGNNGGNGNNASGITAGTGGTAGAALADGYLKGSLAGLAGGNGGDGSNSGGGGTAGTIGNNGSNTSNSIGSNAGNGGAGGQGGTGDGAGAAGGGSGTGGTATASNVKLIANWHLATLLDIGATGASVKFDNSASAGSGGGGGGGDSMTSPPNSSSSGGGGGGGGSGSGGGILAIYAKNIVVGSGGVISANGGNGGNGGNGANGVAAVGCPNAGGGGGGGGGSAGNGGQVIIVYNSLTNSGSITASAGTGGTGGTGGNNAQGGKAIDGSSGANGSAGSVRYFQISL